VEWVKTQTVRFIDTQITMTRQDETLKSITNILAEYGEYQRSDLLRKTRMFKQDFDKALNTLVESGEIEVVTEKTLGRTRLSYRLSSPEG
jgi:predicted ArsR family transcriptional regulator